jgi:hypothetical protein
VDLLFFPIDTLKTRLQSAQGFVNAGGFKGVYRGVGIVVVGSAPGGKCHSLGVVCHKAIRSIVLLSYTVLLT